MKNTLISIGLVVLLLTIAATPLVTAIDWPMVGQNPQHTSYTSTTVPSLLSKDEMYPRASLYPAVANNKVYFFDSELDRFVCMDAETGNVIWQKPDFLFSTFKHSTPSIVDGKVYVWNRDGNSLYCYNAENGIQLWEYPSIGLTYMVTVVDGFVYCSAGAYSSTRIVCLNANTGVEAWEFLLSDISPRWATIPAVQNGKVYFGSYNTNDDSVLFCVDATDGSEIWRYTIENKAIESDRSVTLINNRVYGVFTNHVRCFDAIGNGDGTTDELWMNYITQGYTGNIPAATMGKIVVGARAGVEQSKLYCYDAITGDNLWEKETGGLVSPVIVSDKIITAGQDNQLHIYDLNGIQLGDPIAFGQLRSPIVVADINGFGQIYIADSDEENGQGGLYRVGNLPPEAPTLKGESFADVDVTYTYTAETTDPDDDLIQYWFDFGDGEYTYWIPQEGVESGEEVSVSHTWTEPGTYEVSVKAWDQNEYESTVTRQTVVVSRIKITSASGGFGVNAQIKNVGNVGKDLEWKVDVIGGTIPGFHIFKHYNDSVKPIDPQETVTISSGPIFGLGKTKIMISAEVPGEQPVEKVVDAFVLFFYVIIQ